MCEAGQAIIQTSKHHRPCPYCGKLVGGNNPSILEINFALHLKKHELRGDSLHEGMLQRVGHALRSTLGLGIAIIGFFGEEWVLPLTWFPVIGQPFWIWLVGGIGVGGVVFKYFFPQYHDNLRDRLARVEVWLLNFIIGAWGRAFWTAFWGNLPLYQDPWIWALWGLYAAFLLGVLLLKSSFGRLSKSDKPRWGLDLR